MIKIGTWPERRWEKVRTACGGTDPVKKEEEDGAATACLFLLPPRGAHTNLPDFFFSLAAKKGKGRDGVKRKKRRGETGRK